MNDESKDRLTDIQEVYGAMKLLREDLESYQSLYHVQLDLNKRLDKILAYYELPIWKRLFTKNPGDEE